MAKTQVEKERPVIKLLRDTDPIDIARRTDGTLQFRDAQPYQIRWPDGTEITFQDDPDDPMGLPWLERGEHGGGAETSSAVILRERSVTVVYPGPDDQTVCGYELTTLGYQGEFNLRAPNASRVLRDAKRLAHNHLPWR